ncbi:hypothetical protein L0U95_04080 [Burkholderia cenocepacia]|uniref:hypothetical protein n=1 Tax=Burkholderia cenocepacia TaxID=95486 RepID=UPI001F2F6CF1|nr:hypothetical protein [Burkholderia cenocepacia]UJH74108.1 hypothetical protein L0U95_04080 [Burkholderia cenocepacia]
MARKLFIHCGLHKTATTALQTAFSNNSEKMRSMGLLYPRTGRLSDVSGHHNIAWQLARDRRFNRSFGTLDRLFDEVSSFDGDVVLSSEDFESSLTRPERWGPLLRMAERCNFEPVAIIYLRNQASYLESLYLEMLKHGFGEEFSIYAMDVLSSGSPRFKEWIFHFDYIIALRTMSSIPGLRIVPRNYDACVNGSIAADFLNAVDTVKPIHIEVPHANQRDTLIDALTNFYRNRVERPLQENEIAAVHHLCSHVSEQPAISRDLRNALRKRFSTSNLEICNAHKLNRVRLTDFSHQEPLTRSVCMERVFSFETHVSLSTVAAILEGNLPEPGPGLHTIVEIWSAWVHAQ